MIEAFFGSKARALILKTFLLNPEKTHYLRQLSRDLSLQLNSVRRELLLLQKIGLISEVKEKLKSRETKLYEVNKNFVLFPELQALLAKGQILSAYNFLQNLKKIGQVKLFLLSGVFCNDLSSPSDLLVVYKGAKEKFLLALKKFEKEIGGEIRYTLMDEEELAYRFQIADSFALRLLRGEKIVLLQELESLFLQNKNYENS